MTKTLVRASAILASSALMFGCATTAEQQQLRSELDEVRAIAEKAAADAAAARDAAAAAQSRADAAMDVAAGAKTQSEETEAKIDRMFKKAMYK